MSSKLFRGWKDVFRFTFTQGVSGKNFKLATMGLTILLFIVGMAISIIMAYSQKKDATELSPIEVVHIIDESEIQVLYLDGFMEVYKENYPTLSFVQEKSTVQELNEKLLKDSDEEGSKDVILQIGKADKGYRMTLYLPQNSVIKESEAEELLEDITLVMEQSKLISSGIPMEKLVLMMSSISTTMLDAGEEEKGIGEELVILLLPTLCMLFIYMMNIVYGQGMGNIVSMEKNSKLMEMMLTLTQPYSLIFGKILATTCIAIMQMTLWVGGLVVGFLLGDVVAQNVVYPEYTNDLLEIFRLLGSKEGSTAFSIGAFIIAFLTVCLAFLFYCVLAGLIASFSAKAETLAQVMSYYTIIMVLGFFGAYFLPLQEKEWLNTLLRICPLTSAYMLPGDIVVGNITVAESILYVAILMASSIALVIAAGKIYKNQLFYKGTGLKSRFKKKNKAEA